MNSLAKYVESAMAKNASDIHIESGVSVNVRVSGQLHAVGDPVAAQQVDGWIHELISDEQRSEFVGRGSLDFSAVIGPARCRVNLFYTRKGKGLAIRLLTSFQASLRDCNLHPEIGEFLKKETGLLVITGATGSGKSTTMAALVEEINRQHKKHIICLESPIEYIYSNKRSLVRQREVGRHTPSFEQGLMDSLREDPDVLIIGEMRSPETMRLTLTAAETGHLVIATMHSGTAADAIQRMVASFPDDTGPAVRAQLADCLVGVVAQELEWLPDHKLRVPVCEILSINYAVQTKIRNGEFAQLVSLIQTGAADKMWSFPRYRDWVKKQKHWVTPDRAEKSFEINDDPAEPAAPRDEPRFEKKTAKPAPASASKPLPGKSRTATKTAKVAGRIEIPDVDLDLDDIVSDMVDDE